MIRNDDHFKNLSVVSVRVISVLAVGREIGLVGLNEQFLLFERNVPN